MPLGVYDPVVAPDLTTVECFVSLAEHRHFGHVADALGISISTVTKRLHRLEESLGVPLVERSSGGFGALTPASQRFLEVAPGLLRSAHEATQAAAGESRLTLRVAIPAGMGVVAPLVPAALAKRHSMSVEEFALQPMLYSPELPTFYLDPFVLADVRPRAEARLAPLPATTTAHVAQRLLQGREVTVVPLALTANLPPELSRVLLRGVPESWYYVHHRADDDRPELATAIQLMTDFTESISRSANLTVA